MKRNILLVGLLFCVIILGGCNNDSKKDISVEELITQIFDNDLITEIEECDYVKEKSKELGLYDVEVEIVDKKNEDSEIELECKITYADDYVKVKEEVICTASKLDSGWRLDEVEGNSEEVCTYYPIKFPDEITYSEEKVTNYNSYEGESTTTVVRMKHVINDNEKSALFVSDYFEINDATVSVVEINEDKQSGEVLIEINAFNTKNENKKCILTANLVFNKNLGLWEMKFDEQSSELIVEYNNVYDNYALCNKEDFVEIEDENAGSVYYLNFQPGQELAWLELAEIYKEETGIDVKVVTPNVGEYESTLQEELVSDDAPTLFQVGGPEGLAVWQDYCYDLTNAKVTEELTSESYALKTDGNIYGIGYVIDSYGIIVNKTLLKEAGYEISDINSFDDLKAVAESITKRSDKLGFAAFTSAGMDSSSDWRYKTHLANLPIYFEYQTDGIDSTDAIKGTYLDNYRDIFDLYINNSTCDGKNLEYKTDVDSRNEFINEEAVFWQNGSWEYQSLSYYFYDDELTMIPIYIGAGNEAKQGLCTGTENYWCVNKNASKEDIQATLDFMYWCVTSKVGTETMRDEMGYCIPFKQAAESNNLFLKQDALYTAGGKVPVTFTFSTMPSEAWKNGVGTALTTYAADQTDYNWNKVVEAFVNGWVDENYYSQNTGNNSPEGEIVINLHYHRTDNNYDDWSVWMWPDGVEGYDYQFGSTVDNDGVVATATFSKETKQVGFIVRTSEWVKDYEYDQYIYLEDYYSVVDVYVESGIEGYQLIWD